MKKIIIISSVIILLGSAISPTVMAEKKSSDKIDGQYIIAFKEGVDVDMTTSEMVMKQGLGHLFTYKHALKGFAANIPDNKLKNIKDDPRVAYVAEDRIMQAFGKPSGPVVTQPSQVIPAGINRIGAASTTNKGEGIAVAILDTGIDLDHPDLKGNIIPDSGISCIPRTTTNDDNGHGTHVAGTIAAVNNGIGVVGVASAAKLVPVKVLDKKGSGSSSTIIRGIDWVTANAAKYNIKVVNMSLGGPGTSDGNCGLTNNDPLHQAICRSRDAGITYVVAAGNEAQDAANAVPAAYDEDVITVSALADYDGIPGNDTFASFSNYGDVVDLGAPGVNIYSTFLNGGYVTKSGTSMAAPHASGAAAIYISLHPGSSWDQVRDGLAADGEKIGEGHSDPSGNHPEAVVDVSTY